MESDEGQDGLFGQLLWIFPFLRVVHFDAISPFPKKATGVAIAVGREDTVSIAKVGSKKGAQGSSVHLQFNPWYGQLKDWPKSLESQLLQVKKEQQSWFKIFLAQCI